MKKNLLLIVMAFLFSSLAAGAHSVRIEVDDINNVTITKQQGNGEQITLDPYGTSVQIEDSDNPLLIEPANGATIESVEVNGFAQSASGDGKYRVGITGGTRIVISTSGGGVQNISVTYFNMGDSNSATVTYGDGMVLASGIAATMPAGTELKVSPADAYRITNVNMNRSGSATANEDGTWTCIPTSPSSFIDVYTEATGLKFKIDVDLAANLKVYAGNDDSTELNLYDGNNNVVLSEEKQPLHFVATDGAEILKVLRNDEEVQGSPYSGIRTQFAEGDVFKVTTRGKEVSVTFNAPEDNAALENYTFTVDGTNLTGITGSEASASVHLGDIVTVTPKGATTLDYLIGGKSVSAEKPSQAVRINKENTVVYVYGKAAKGVNINVDDAARVIVKQANGYGDVLTLESGLNSFKEVTNSLQITAAAGCQILSVTLDDEVVTPQNTGAYLVEATEGCYIDITSREIPDNIPVTFSVAPKELIGYLDVTVGEKKVELNSDSQTLSVEFGATVTATAQKGYKITSLTAGNNLVEQVAANSYSFIAGEACTVAVVMEKIQATEGYAIVNVSADSKSVSFDEYDGDKYVQTLTDENVNQVKKGNKLQIKASSTGLYIKEVKVNGEAISIPADSRIFSFTIDKDCDVIVTTLRKVDISLYETRDPVNHSMIGKLFVKNGEELVTNYFAAEGETITFATEITDGYQLDYIKRVYPESDQQYHDSYTVTAEDINLGGYLIFEGVYSLEPGKRSFVVRCNDTYLDTDYGKQLIAYCRIEHDGDEFTERRFIEGDTAHLLAYTDEIYDLKNFALWRNNDVIIPEYYVVNGEHADEEGVIDVQVICKRYENGVSDIMTEGSLSYDKNSRKLTSDADIEVYDTAGTLVLKGNGTLNVDRLENGLYIAVSGKSTMKFVK